MAEENNVHVKLAMAEPLGCFLIAWIAFMVGMVGLDQFGLDVATTKVSEWVGYGLIILAVVAFLNENILCSAIFGVLGLFFQAFPFVAGGDVAATATVVAFVGFFLLIAGLVAFAQPVKLLPILLIVAAIAFFMLALWWSDLGNDTYKMLTGFFMVLTSLLAFYLGTGVTLLVMKGKQILPLFIKA